MMIPLINDHLFYAFMKLKRLPVLTSDKNSTSASGLVNLLVNRLHSGLTGFVLQNLGCLVLDYVMNLITYVTLIILAFKRLRDFLTKKIIVKEHFLHFGL